MSTTALPGGHTKGFLSTFRKDSWWIEPALTAALLGFFILYATIVAFQASYYVAGPYLSPFYSPMFFQPDPSAVTVPGGAHDGASLFGYFPSWVPHFLQSPALLVVPLPTMFRGTCYYYRKAYYRTFLGMPPGCAVGAVPVPGRYEGETFLLVFQNLHRYALYIGIALLPFLWYEAAMSFWFNGTPGVGIGSILLTVNAALLTGYTLGCHSFRHLVGGKLNCFSCDAQSEARGKGWWYVSWLNARHMNFAWTSLIWFLVTDMFIRGMSMGFFPDINTWAGIATAEDMANLLKVVGAH